MTLDPPADDASAAPSAAEAIAAVLTRMAREDGPRVLAGLAAQFADLDLAEDVVAESLAEAVEHWPRDGVPENPAGWVTVVARRKAIDRIRRRDAEHRRWVQAAPHLLERTVPTEMPSLIVDDRHVEDERLRLLLLCCHPALDVDTQVALTLRLVGGLTTAEIAAAYLVPEATLAQRLVRAKRKIRDARIPLTVPTTLGPRVEALLGVLFLVFNEGYLSRGDGADAVRGELVDEAVRLTTLAARMLPDDAEARGLLALMLYHRARFATRVDAAGELVLLADQDRSRWDAALIARAGALLADAMSRRSPGTYQLQALIAAQHAIAATAAETDWAAIVLLYEQLLAMTGSEVVRLNHAVAVSMVDGPRAGLTLVNRIIGLDRYHLLHAARGDLLLRLDRPTAAAAAFATAGALTDNPAERRHLHRRWVDSHGDRPEPAAATDRGTRPDPSAGCP